MPHVPYKGVLPLVADLLANIIGVGFVDIASTGAGPCRSARRPCPFDQNVAHSSDSALAVMAGADGTLPWKAPDAASLGLGA